MCRCAPLRFCGCVRLGCRSFVAVFGGTVESLLALIGLVVTGALVWEGWSVWQSHKRGEPRDKRRVIGSGAAFLVVMAITPEPASERAEPKEQRQVKPASLLSSDTPQETGPSAEELAEAQREAAGARAEAIAARKARQPRTSAPAACRPRTEGGKRAKARAERRRRKPRRWRPPLRLLPEPAEVRIGGVSVGANYAGMTCDEIGHSSPLPSPF